ncbi:hypothetical protein FRC12_011213 [Ceratobasidium sp. 428]|nr:hypothetical protein FRC12_011213 [Ceratobasidium sp. 428]
MNFNLDSLLAIDTTLSKFELAFLVSNVLKRDVVGRKPWRMVFATQGLTASEGMSADVACEYNRYTHDSVYVNLGATPVWATFQDMKQTEVQLADIWTDLLCELPIISTMRSELDGVEQRLAELVAHARNFRLFQSFAAQIALHHAQFAHVWGREDRAVSCYEVSL